MKSLFLGKTEDGGRLDLGPEDLETHVHGVGASRTGKSKLIEWIAREMIRARQGLDLKVFFRQHGRVTKDQIAEAIGEWFPQLASRVPPQRKAWQPEHWRTPLFDAMATAMAYLADDRADLGGG